MNEQTTTAPKPKEVRLYLATVDGVQRLIRGNDPRGVRNYIIEGLKKPEIDVKIPTPEEAIDAALDGVKIEDPTAAPAPEKDKESGEGKAEPDDEGQVEFDPQAAAGEDDALGISAGEDRVSPDDDQPDLLK